MEKDKEPTEILFRKYSNGDIIALMPYVIEDNRFCCQSYMHVGQHGPARYEHMMQCTRPAKEDEYAELKRELESIGYNVLPITRINRKKLDAAIRKKITWIQSAGRGIRNQNK